MFISQVTLKNFRCFQKEQKIRLAPLTLLMGENSTGKTSFMALLRTLMNTIYGGSPDFKDPPYDLGAFDNIIYRNNTKKNGSRSFEAGLELTDDKKKSLNIHITFGKKETKSVHPSSIKERISDKNQNIWLESDMNLKILNFHTPNGTWKTEMEKEETKHVSKSKKKDVNIAFLSQHLLEHLQHQSLFTTLKVLNELPLPLDWIISNSKASKEDLRRIRELISDTRNFFHLQGPPIYASAPVRSKPQRTYNPTPRAKRDPEGEGIIYHFAELSWQDPLRWKKLKKQLEGFGKQAGLFDEISIKRFKKAGSSPFEVEIRTAGQTKALEQNLIDVGYGVSQILPVVAELLLPDIPPLFLFQQPEVHLHPSAQAALGSFFCQVVEKRKTQLVIETHGDYLMDRIRMDIRDRKTKLKPEDVSILFFERKGQSVNIHSIEIDKQGDVLNPPPGYRQFFLKENNRFLGLD